MKYATLQTHIISKDNTKNKKKLTLYKCLIIFLLLTWPIILVRHFIRYIYYLHLFVNNCITHLYNKFLLLFKKCVGAKS